MLGPGAQPQEAPMIEARKERLLGEINTVVMLGMALEGYLADCPSPTMEDFLSLQHSDVPSWGLDLLGGVISDWRDLCKETGDLITDIAQVLTERGVALTPASMGRFLLSLRDPDGAYASQGESKLINHGAYLVIEAENKDDYNFWSSGKHGTKRSSGGEYWHEMEFFYEEKTYRVPVLLIGNTETQETRRKTLVHELQHLINRRFGKIYKTGEPEESFFVKLQDEIIAGIREGETTDQMIERLGGSMELYEEFLNGTEMQNKERERILLAFKTALDEPIAKMLFVTAYGRTLLAFHLMSASPLMLAQRVRALRDYFLSKLPFLKSAQVATDHPLMEAVLNNPQLFKNDQPLGDARSHFIQALQQAIISPDTQCSTVASDAYQGLLSILHSSYSDSGEIEIL